MASRSVPPARFKKTTPHAIRRILLAALAAVSLCHAQEDRPLQPAPPAEEAPDRAAEEAFARFRSGTLDLPTLIEVLPRLASPDDRATIRETIIGAKQPPREALVMLLDHPLLAVRLASLELLEEMAGGDLGYNPWTPAESPENAASLARWRAWTGEPPDPSSRDGLFSDEQRRTWLRDLLAGDADKAARARRMWEAEGLAAVGFLESFLQQTPTLPAGSRTRIREAQYQIALARQFGDQAAHLARQLAFGSRDQLLASIAAIRASGPPAVPILRDFITHPDPLVRETAIDALLVAGGEPAVGLVGPLLVAEPDVNVIHGALRRLKDIRTPATAALVARFLDHPDEDLLISAIQTAMILAGGESHSFNEDRPVKSSAADDAVLERLGDERWRVRAAALEYVEKRKLNAAREPAIALLDDTDEFVRFAAMKAVVALRVTKALPGMKAGMLADPTLAPQVFAAHAAMKSKPDAEMLAALDAAPAEIRLATVRALAESDAPVDLLQRFAADGDPDVAAISLRFLASDDDRLANRGTLGLLVAALKENNPAKTAAIVERIDLPAASARLDPRLRAVADALAAPRQPTALDPLYDAFLGPAATAAVAASPVAAPPAAVDDLVEALATLLTPETPDEIRFHSALGLARAGHAQGFEALLRDLPSYDTARKATIGSRLYNPSSADALPLLTALMRDPVAEVRSSAAEAALSNENAPALIALVLTELGQPDSPLKPSEVYGYRFESAARSAPAIFRDWCAATFADEAAAIPRRVLACIAARHCANPALVETLRAHTTADSPPLLRRAAWHALLTLRPAELATHAPTIAADPEAFVRAVLADRVTRANYVWQHRFSDSDVQRDNYYSYGREARAPRPDAATRELLAKLATTDPSPVIRFEAAFALLNAGAPADLDALATLLPRLPEETNAARRVADWLGENAERATPALRPLVAVIDPATIRRDKLATLNARVNPGSTKGPLTFAELARSATTTATEADAPPLAPDATGDGGDDPADLPPRQSLDLVYFQKTGCAECAKARQFLDSLKRDFPLLAVEEHNILSPDGTLLNQALCSRLAVPAIRHTVAPAVFTQAGFVIGPEITHESLARLLAETMTLPQDDAWKTIEETETTEAGREVDRRYRSLTLPVVLIAGLLDGINPCAFATIIFFLSYLQIARRTPREMLLTGAAFISAVFLAYFAAGLLLYQILDTLHARLGGIQRWLNPAFAALALVAAILSLRDALRARAGRLDEMTLQLPGMLKDRIRGVIRTGARARRFIIAAFLSGIVISFLELACTGQVYAPIVYQIHRGNLDAVAWLALYNVAFIVPLIAIFLLAYGGLRSESLIRFQHRHTFSVKLALAALFLLLAAFLLFGHHLLPA